MYLNNFSVVVEHGNEISGGYVEMQHSQQYNLRLRNDRPMRCDSRVEIDGKHVGTWRINAHQTITLERPAHDTGRFTFYRVNSQEALNIGLDYNDPNLGVIKVTFTPEKRYEQVKTSKPDVVYRGGARGMSASYSPVTLGAGGTGLSGMSSQHFGIANEIQYDYSQETVIHLRLVERNMSYANEARPLTQYSTPIPPRV